MASATSDTFTSTRIRGPFLTAARIVWVALALISVGIFVAMLPGRFEQLGKLFFVGEEAVRQLGLTASSYAWYHIVLEAITTLVFVVVGLTMFWQRSNDWTALIVSAAMVMYGALNSFPVYAPILIYPDWQWLIDTLVAIATVASLIAFYIMPDGHFVPRWTRFLAAGIGLWAISWVVFPNSPVNFLRWDETPTMTIPLYVAQSLMYGSCILAQVYRYLRVSTPEQRQQTKWAVYGAGIVIVTYIALNLPLSIFPVLQSGMPRLIYTLIHKFVLATALVILPVCFAVAVLRYRLWQVDFVIHRSLVYGSLTVLLLIAFGIILLGLNALIATLMGGQGIPSIAVVASAVAVGLLFQPVRTRLRRVVDRLYGIEIDYRRAIKERAARQQAARRLSETRTSFGRYSGVELMGRGGMGEIYRGFDPTLGRNVAIKLLPMALAEDEAVRKRFTREAQTIARLKHPNIVGIQDYGELDGTLYMVMDYVEGYSLSECLKERGFLPLDEALPTFQDIALALDYAHSLGVIHRDIKPSNVMLEPLAAPGAGRTQRAVLMDFGIAKITARGVTRLTQTGMIGTLDYIAPEQIHDAADVDARADVYSFGVLVYQVLTGELPFRRANPAATLIAHLLEPPQPPSRFHPELSPRIDAAILQAMSKRPEDRYGSAREFVAALDYSRILRAA